MSNSIIDGPPSRRDRARSVAIDIPPGEPSLPPLPVGARPARMHLKYSSLLTIPRWSERLDGLGTWAAERRSPGKRQLAANVEDVDNFNEIHAFWHAVATLPAFRARWVAFWDAESPPASSIFCVFNRSVSYATSPSFPRPGNNLQSYQVVRR